MEVPRCFWVGGGAEEMMLGLLVSLLSLGEGTAAC